VVDTGPLSCFGAVLQSSSSPVLVNDTGIPARSISLAELIGRVHIHDWTSAAHYRSGRYRGYLGSFKKSFWASALNLGSAEFAGWGSTLGVCRQHPQMGPASPLTTPERLPGTDRPPAPKPGHWAQQLLPQPSAASRQVPPPPPVSTPMITDGTSQTSSCRCGTPCVSIVVASCCGIPKLAVRKFLDGKSTGYFLPSHSPHGSSVYPTMPTILSEKESGL